MKDFNDVVTAIKMCSSNYCSHPEYGDCPYMHDNGCLKHLKSDALYYLEEYKGLSKMWNDKLDEEQNNPPLTWDELKGMEGKPIWIEVKYHNPEETYKYWTIVKYFDSHEGGDMVFTGTGFYHKDLLGIDWQAYRKERYDN